MLQLFVIDFPNISPVAFSLGPFDIHWYGLAYAVGSPSAGSTCASCWRRRGCGSPASFHFPMT